MNCTMCYFSSQAWQSRTSSFHSHSSTSSKTGHLHARAVEAVKSAPSVFLLLFIRSREASRASNGSSAPLTTGNRRASYSRATDRPKSNAINLRRKYRLAGSADAAYETFKQPTATNPLRRAIAVCRNGIRIEVQKPTADSPARNEGEIAGDADAVGSRERRETALDRAAPYTTQLLLYGRYCVYYCIEPTFIHSIRRTRKNRFWTLRIR